MMKIRWFLLLAILLAPIEAISQSYLNVKFTDDSYKNAEIVDVEELTFSQTGDQLTIKLSNQTQDTYPLGNVAEMTFDDFAQGEPVPVELLRFEIVFNHQTATEIESRSSLSDEAGSGDQAGDSTEIRAD